MRLLMTIIASLFAIPAWAVDWGNEYDRAIAMPGTKVTTSLDLRGQQTRQIRLASGILFIQTIVNGKVQTAGIDNTGVGAVLCFRQLFALAKLADLTCRSGRSKAAPRIDEALDRIAAFVASNSIPPVSKEAAYGYADKYINGFRASLAKASAKQREDFCKADTSTAVKLLNAYNTDQGRSIKQSIDKLLAVRRPAVMNPCI